MYLYSYHAYPVGRFARLWCVLLDNTGVICRPIGLLFCLLNASSNLGRNGCVNEKLSHNIYAAFAAIFYLE